jgi:hypothetical protein
MSEAPPNGRPKVFISYAHESEALRASVKDLADWLGERGCTVVTDHRFINRPPAEGWQIWMLKCIDEAQSVLVVCTPKLKARYEKAAPPDEGFGATYEGAIVTQHIYDRAMRNTKFFPILPDGGNGEDIPTTLRPWSNGHRFPSGQERILALALDEQGNVGTAQPLFAAASSDIAENFPEAPAVHPEDLLVLDEPGNCGSAFRSSSGAGPSPCQAIKPDWLCAA